MVFWASFHPWDEKMYFPSVPVINFMSFSSTRLPQPSPALSYWSWTLQASFPIASWLALRLDNRSVGGTMHGWERKKGLFLPLPFVCFSERQQAGTPVALRGGGRPPVAASSGHLHPRQHYHHRAAHFLTQEPPLWGLRPAGMQALYSEFLSFFLVHISLRPPPLRVLLEPSP